MKQLKILSLTLFILAISSCNKDEFSLTNSEKEHNYNWNNLEKQFFTLQKNVLSRTREGDGNYHPLLLDAYKFLAKENQSRPYVNNWVSKMGMPNWEKARVYFNNDQIRTNRDYRIAIPFIKPNSLQVYTVVTLAKKGTSPYKVSLISKKQILESTDCRYKSHIKEIMEMEHALFNNEDPLMKEKQCNCIDHDFDEHPPHPQTETENPCEKWIAVKYCIDTQTGYEWWGEKLPIMKDHDQDGIINEDDQDWYDLKQKYNITEQQYIEFFESRWEEYLEEHDLDINDYPFEEYFDGYIDDDFNEYGDPSFDLFDDFMDGWDAFFDDEGIWDQFLDELFDKDDDGIRNWDDNDDSPQDGYDDRGCYFDGPLKGIKTENRTIECEWFWVRLCDLQNTSDYLNQLLSYLEPCPECNPSTDQAFDQRLMEFCGKYDLSQNDCEWLRDNATDCPVFAPFGVTETCFKDKLRYYSLEFLTSLLNNYQDYSDDQTFNLQLFIQQHTEQGFITMANAYLDAKENGENIDWSEFVEAANIWGNNTIPPVEEIQNGITILESTVLNTSPNNYFLAGGTAPRGNTEDLEHGTYGNTQGIKLGNKTQQELFTEMNDLMTDFSTGVLEGVGLDMVQFFDNNNDVNNVYTNNALSSEILVSKEMRNFVKRFGNELNLRFKSFGFGYIEAINMPQETRPIFNSNYHKINGLTICVNDTEETRVSRFDDLSFDTNTGVWEVTLYIEMYDHFGLDRHDVLTYQSYNEGFAAWWRLQHVHNQFPFNTLSRLSYKIKGKTK